MTKVGDFTIPMEYVEIKDGFSVKKDDIIAVERAGEYQTYLHMNNGKIFETNFPYMTILNLLENEKEVDNNLNSVLQSVGHLAS